MKRWIALITALALAALCLPACASADGEEQLYTEVEFSKTDLNESWDESTATRVAMNGENAAITGSGAAFADGVLTISSPGDYLLSGTLAGSVVVEIGKEEKARLILNGVEITSSDAPAIYVKSADKVTLTLANGTKNTLTDGERGVAAEGEEDANACLYAKDDLSINGGGALRIVGNSRHGINCKDDVRIAGGDIEIIAVEDGVRARDSFAMAGGSLTIECGGDGIHSSNTEDAGKGLIALSGGDIAITAESDGAQAAQRLQITGGTIRVTCGGGAGDVSSNDYTASRGGWDMWGNWDMNGDGSADSMKGLKSDGDLIIAGGDIDIDSEDDSVHAAGDVTVAGGSLTLKSGDDGLHSDATVTVAGGVIDIQKSYEGVEGVCVTVSGGVLSVVASDDGINAAGTFTVSSTDGEAAQAATDAALNRTSQNRGGKGASGSFGGRGGMMMDANTDNVIRITGGSVYVNASGDGVDSNGSLYIEGGQIVIDGPSNSMNGALDTGYDVFVTGGVLIAAGAGGMEETPGQSSSQPSIYAQTALNKGDLFAVTDESGALVCAFTAAKSHSSVIVSAPVLTLGQSYSLKKGGSVSGGSENGLYLSGAYTGGEQLANLTLNAVVTSTSVGNQRNNRWGR